MPSLKQLEKQKAELDFKIYQSLEILKKMDAELEQARLRQEQVDKGTAEILAVMEKYQLRPDDVFPDTPSNVTSIKPKPSQTLSEMRQFFNRG